VDFKVEAFSDRVRHYVKLNESTDWINVKHITTDLFEGVYLSIKGDYLFTSVVLSDGSSERFELSKCFGETGFPMPNRIYLNYFGGSEPIDVSGVIIDDEKFYSTDPVEWEEKPIVITPFPPGVTDPEEEPIGPGTGEPGEEPTGPGTGEPGEDKPGPGSPGFVLPDFSIPKIELPEMDFEGIEDFGGGIGFLVNIFNMIWEALGPVRFIVLYSPLLAVSMFFIGKGRKC
jgi:hypothetical protein